MILSKIFKIQEKLFRTIFYNNIESNQKKIDPSKNPCLLYNILIYTYDNY